MVERQPAYVPPLRFRWATPLFDALLATFLRERRWRADLVAAINPQPGDVIVDVGCGTGTLIVSLKRTEPSARIIGIDPDPDGLAIAQRKAEREGLHVETWRALGGAWPPEAAAARPNKIVSSLVLHQVKADGKNGILQAAFIHMQPGGRLIILDYGAQTGVARAFYAMTELLDGFEATRPNRQGVIPSMVADHGFSDVCERWRLLTVSGSLSLYEASKPA